MEYFARETGTSNSEVKNRKPVLGFKISAASVGEAVKEAEKIKDANTAYFEKQNAWVLFQGVSNSPHVGGVGDCFFTPTSIIHHF